MVDKSLLEELKQIFKEDYGIELSDKALREVADFISKYFNILKQINDDI